MATTGSMRLPEISTPDTPPTDKHRIYVGTDNKLKKVDDAGLVTTYGAEFTTEDAQDAVGAMVDSTLVYVDGTPLLTRAALTGDVTAAQASNSTTIANNAVTNAKLNDMNAWTVKVRNAGTSGDPSDAALADITEELTPATGDFLFGFLSSGEIRKFDVGNLPGGGGGSDSFKTINCPAGTDPVADSNADTLNLTSSDSTITITGDSSTDSINFDISDNSVTFAKMQDIATDTLIGRSTSGTGDPETISCTAAGRAILDDANASAQRTTLGLAIGTDVQAFDADLSAIAALSSTGIAARTASNTWAQRTIAAGTGIGVTDGDGVSGNPTVAITDSELLAIAGLSSAADTIIQFTGSGTAQVVNFKFGTYSPTYTGVANITTAAGAATLNYIRFGDKVVVFGIATPTPTAAADTTTTMRISLPIASNFTTTSDCAGTATTGVTQRGGRIQADATNDEAQLTFASQTTSTVNFTFIFFYTIK
jgi:hypothetical protein